MPDNLEQDGGLSERLLARATNVGVVDVAWAQQHYARSADFVAERFGVLGDLNARYGTVDSRGAGTSSALPVAPGRYAGAQPETGGGGDDLTPTDGGGGIQRKAVEAGATPARGGGGGSGAPSGGGGTGPTLQRKAAGPEPSHSEAATSEPAPASSEKSETHEQSAPFVSKESAPTASAAQPSLMRLASETPRARAGDAGATLEEQPMTLAEAPSASAAQPPAREVVQLAGIEDDELVQRKPAPVSSPAAEPAGAEASTSAEPPRLTLAREESPRTTSGSTPAVMRAARGRESAPTIQRSATVKEDSATTRAVETPLAISETAPAPSASASFASAHAGVEHPAVAHSTAGQAMVQRAAVQASESQAPSRLSAPEIQRAASLPLAPRMVLRKSVGASTLSAGGPDAARGPMPYVTPSAVSPSAANSQTLSRAASSQPMLMRDAEEAGGAVGSHAPAAPAPPSAGGPSLEQITEHVSRVILRRLAVERERRGVRRWL